MEKYLKNGIELRKQGKFEDAINIINEGLLKYKKDLKLLELKAIILDESNRLEEAVEIYKEIYELKPVHQITLPLLGLALNRLGKNEEALKYLDEAKNIYPNNPNIYLSIAINLWKKNELDKALENIDKSIEIEPNNENSWAIKAEIHKIKNEYKPSLIAIEKAISLNPKNIEYWMKKCYLLHFMGKNEIALNTINYTLKLNKYDAKLLRLKYLTLKNLKLFKKALEVIKEYERLFPEENPLHLEKALLYDALGKRKKSINYIEKGINSDPNNHVLWLVKSMILANLQDYDHALFAINKAINLKPMNKNLWIAKGVLLFQCNSKKESLDSFEEAIKIDPEDKSIHTYITEIYLSLGDRKNAELSLNIALSADKNKAEALFFDAMINIEEKRYFIASNLFKQAIALEMENYKYILWDIYAKYLHAEFIIGEGNQSYNEEISIIISNLEKLKNNIPKQNISIKVYILYFLGCFYFKLKDYYSALENLKECINYKTKIGIENKAGDLLSNIWNYKIRPRWWKWWLFSPYFKKTKILIFCISFSLLAILIFLPVFINVLTTFIPEINAHSPYSKDSFSYSLFYNIIDMDIIIYAFIVSILFFILISPNIERIRIRDVEIEMPTPSIVNIFPTNALQECINKIEWDKESNKNNNMNFDFNPELKRISSQMKSKIN